MRIAFALDTEGQSTRKPSSGGNHPQQPRCTDLSRMDVEQRLKLDEGNVPVYLAHGQHVVLNDGVLQHRQACRITRHSESEPDDTLITICYKYDQRIGWPKLAWGPKTSTASPRTAEKTATTTVFGRHTIRSLCHLMRR